MEVELASKGARVRSVSPTAVDIQRRSKTLTDETFLEGWEGQERRKDWQLRVRRRAISNQNRREAVRDSRAARPLSHEDDESQLHNASGAVQLFGFRCI
jgi:hypothetical protein